MFVFTVDHSIASVRGPGDVLTCGACSKQFSLGDIVRFIQHKVRSCPASISNHSSYQHSTPLHNNNNFDAKNNHLTSSPNSPTTSNPCTDDEDDPDEFHHHHHSSPRNGPSINTSFPRHNSSSGDGSTNSTTNPNNSTASLTNTTNHLNSSPVSSNDHSISSSNHCTPPPLPSLNSIPVVKSSISAPISRRSKNHAHHHHHHAERSSFTSSGSGTSVQHQSDKSLSNDHSSKCDPKVNSASSGKVKLTLHSFLNN